MGPDSLVYPAARADKAARAYHPYHRLDSLNNLRHQPPAATSTDSPLGYFDKARDTQQPTALGLYMNPSTYFSHDGQDANYSFLQDATPYPAPTFDAETKLDTEDLDIGSLSGGDAEELDSNAQLRSQQLNSDGTPRRPMNAFMIFARKRRPMVSSEQPTMRTGEISKILSKEWSEMPKGDKQFFLDQAKKLKDTFNARWPDYVYRRRPNNSRKRRKQGGASGVGPIRTHDTANDSDGQGKAFGDPNASSQSGDDSRSQSTDNIPSPFSTQHKLLYHTPELSQSRKLDRSSTPASVLAGYSSSVPSPYLQPICPSNYKDEPTLNGFAPQTHRYGVGVFYGCPPGNADTRDHSAELDPKMKAWHPFAAVPSGVVGPPSSPLASTSQAAPQAHHPHLTYPPHAPSNWSKAEPTSDVHRYEAQSAIWGTSPLMAGHHGVGGDGITGFLPSSASSSHQELSPTASSDSNALGIHPYGTLEKNSFESHYQPAYMEVSAHACHALPSFQGGFSAQHGGDSASAYFGSTRWVPSGQSN